MSINTHERKQLVYELRQHLRKAVRELRAAEDLTRLNPQIWADSIAADRIRSIYEQVNEDVLEGSGWKPPLLERLRNAEQNATILADRLAELGELDAVLPKLK